MIGRSYDQTDISPTNKSAKDIENLLNTAEAKNIFNDELRKFDKNDKYRIKYEKY